MVGTHCETEMNGVFYILGSGREESISIHLISSGQYKSIASREIDKIIATYTEDQLSTAILETRVQDKDMFIGCLVLIILIVVFVGCSIAFRGCMFEVIDKILLLGSSPR